MNGFVDGVMSYINKYVAAYMNESRPTDRGFWSWWMALRVVMSGFVEFLLFASCLPVTRLALARQLSDDCNTLQRAATHCNMLQRTRPVSPWLGSFLMTATHFNMLQHTATHRNTHGSSRPGSAAF